MLAFEQQLSAQMFGGNSEKTFIDKMLAREDVDRIREIIKKPRLTRTELLEVLYSIAGNESKLLNYGEWDRYVILKFYVWIREFIKIAELLYDYQEGLHVKEKLCACGAYRGLHKDESRYVLNRDVKTCECEEFKPVFVISERTKRFLDNNERLIEHNAKFLIDLYLNIGRTSLSVGATGLLELLKNKYELVYPQQGLSPGESDKKGWGIFKR